jgi:hypothetical protein
MKTTIVAIVLLTTVFAGSRVRAGDGADLAAYLEQIRASGISEVGKADLATIASICAGGTLLEYRMDEASGRYWPGYMSTTCPKPNADPPEIERWKQLTRSESDVLVGKLKRFADADESGFVTTREASDFRFLVEYGYLVAQVIRDQGAKMELVVRASGKDLETATRDIARYRALASQLGQAGITCLPDVAVANAGAPFN